MEKFAVIVVIIILSFFINLLYYTCWMLTDHWLLESKEEKAKPNDLQDVASLV